MVIPPSGTPADPRRGDRRGGAPSGDGYGLGDVQSLEAMGSDSAGIPEGAVREYAPDRLASSPWTDDLAREGLPLGMFHVGVELRGMFRIGPTAGRGTVPYGGIEIDVNFLLRLAPWFHLRAAAGFGLSTGEDYSRLPCSFGTCYLERGGTGLGTLGLRVLLAFDASRLFSVRIGGELGGEWIAQYAMAQFYGAPEIDFVGQLTDEGRLEIGFAVSAPYQQLCWSSASSGFGGVACYQSFSVQIEIITGVIF